MVDIFRRFGPLVLLSQQGVEHSHSIYKSILRDATSNGTNKSQVKQYFEKMYRIFSFENGVFDHYNKVKNKI